MISQAIKQMEESALLLIKEKVSPEFTIQGY